METLTTFAASPGWDDTPNDTISTSDALSKQHNTSFSLWDNSKLFQEEQSDEYADIEY